jgi:peroxiredoxin
MKAIFFMLILAISMFGLGCKADSQSMRKRDLAGDFTLETIDGEKVVLSDILKEKETILIFWATWCPYCRNELLRMDKFYAENKAKVEVIAIDIEESKQKVESFIRGKEIYYPVVIDSDGSVAQLYKVRGVPTIVVVNRGSRIIHFGHSTENMIDNIDF